MKARGLLGILLSIFGLVGAGFVNAGISVPGTANPYLAAQPDGTTASGGDVAPTNSPVRVTTIVINPGDVLSFVVSGSTNNDPGPSGLSPDGGSTFSRGSEHGLAGYTTHLNSLMGVFVDDSVPGGTAPESFPFSPNDPVFSPGLRQPFFIGDGLTGNGDGSGQRQQFVVPAGATRLFLGSADGCCWYNNDGSFDVQVFTGCWSPGEWHQWTNGHYYSVQPISGPNFGWAVARAQARALTAPNGQPVDLATVTSAEENAFVFSGIDCDTYWAIDGAGNNEGPNLGGFQRNKNNEPAGNWAWVTVETWSYTNWWPTEPNNFDGNENFLTFFAQGNARSPNWNDIGGGTGSVIHYYVAESTDERPCLSRPLGMVAWWPGDANAKDISGGNHDGTVVNGVLFPTGYIGRAFNFVDTANQYVRVPDDPSLRFGPSSPITIELWVYRTSASQTQHFIGKRVTCGAAADGTYQMGVDFVDTPGCGLFFGPAGAPAVCSGVDLPMNTWTHLVGTFDGSTQRLYMNGHQIGSINAPLGQANNAPLLIGNTSESCGNRGTGGSIDEVALYNRALSQSEISSIYVAGSTGKCRSCTTPPAGIVGWYAGDGNATDIGPAVNHGTLTGGVTFPPGMVGKAFGFNGADAYVQAPAVAAQDPTQAGSLDAWVHFNQTPAEAGHIMEVIGKGASCTDFDLQADPDNRFRFYVQCGQNVASNTLIETGIWYHVAGTWDATGLRIYVNGVLENTNGIQNLTRGQSNQPLNIGNQPFFGPRLFSGFIDEAEIFNRALTEPEVQQIFNAGNAGKCKQPPVPLKITSISRPKSGSSVSGNLFIGGQTAPGLTVRIQSASDLLTGFSDEGTVTAGANGRFLFNAGNPARLTRRFYRAVYP